MRTENLDPEKLDPQARPEENAAAESEERDTLDDNGRKQREIKDDGRYIIFYDFEDGDA